MCWSIGASAALTVGGLSVAAYSRRRGDKPAIWATLVYFCAMEGLQAVTYLVIDLCAPTNQFLTVLAYVHIAFQPVFINFISMTFIPDGVRTRIQPVVYALSFASAAVILLQLAPFAWSPDCEIGRVLCGKALCAVSGSWHIGWTVPYHTLGLPMDFPTYIVMGFVVPVLYGSWRFTLFHFVTGPFAAALTTRNPNEWPAVWCLFSVALILIALLGPLRRWFMVTRWFWPPDFAVKPAVAPPI
ncbi:MAG: DUF5765 domain-containing protein [Bauldia sp.]